MRGRAGRETKKKRPSQRPCPPLSLSLPPSTLPLTQTRSPCLHSRPTRRHWRRRRLRRTTIWRAARRHARKTARTRGGRRAGGRPGGGRGPCGVCGRSRGVAGRQPPGGGGPASKCVGRGFCRQPPVVVRETTRPRCAACVVRLCFSHTHSAWGEGGRGRGELVRRGETRRESADARGGATSACSRRNHP